MMVDGDDAAAAGGGSADVVAGVGVPPTAPGAAPPPCSGRASRRSSPVAPPPPPPTDAGTLPPVGAWATQVSMAAHDALVDWQRSHAPGSVVARVRATRSCEARSV